MAPSSTFVPSASRDVTPLGADGLRGVVLLAGATPGDAAGNANSTQVLLSALEELGETHTVSHQTSLVPFYRTRRVGAPNVLLGTQPFSIHGEALLPGWLHRRRLHRYSRGWVVNSRYAGGLYAAGVPYAIWEATTTRDELRASDREAVRRSGRGTGIGRVVHEALLPVGERIEGRLYRGAAVLVAMSEYTRRLMIETHRVPPARVGVLAHPPSRSFLSALRAAERDRPQPRSPTTFRVLFVGRVDDPRKNFPLLLESYLQARREGARVSLTVVGPHTEKWRDALGNLPREHDITIAGRVNENALVRAYLDHQALILSSKQEGFGIVVAEAFHAGLPVISTRCGGPEATIDVSGGGLLTGHSSAEMSRAIAHMATSAEDRERMAARALEHARSELSFDVFRERVRALTAAIPTRPSSSRSLSEI